MQHSPSLVLEKPHFIQHSPDQRRLSSPASSHLTPSRQISPTTQVRREPIRIYGNDSPSQTKIAQETAPQQLRGSPEQESESFRLNINPTRTTPKSMQSSRYQEQPVPNNSGSFRQQSSSPSPQQQGANSLDSPQIHNPENILAELDDFLEDAQPALHNSVLDVSKHSAIEGPQNSGYFSAEVEGEEEEGQEPSQRDFSPSFYLKPTD